ncbi:pyridoxal-phosphate dependent enzyme [Halomonas sp. PR-M31]|uniref:pyridoxal-phosphate dependent enzyme n=1 Tax=Halomonas sp. PR-M31 TaxID=1471202 RepID=UPI00209F16AF|nr:pyridoxal-phosphate dependent enzyme [Halomonas sp. PR-M31]
MAVAYANRRLGIPVTVAVPETSTERAKELLQLEKAEVIMHGTSWQEANSFAESLIGAADAFLHPFDDPLLWIGHATLVDEVYCSGLKPDAVVLSVGGGGLLSSVVEELHRNGWNNILVFTVETTGAASFHAAVTSGYIVELEQITSIVTSLGAKRVCEKAFQYTKEHSIHSVVVSDQDALSACERFLNDHRILVEPACGASLAMAYKNAPELQGFDNILVVVCGGATSTIDKIRELRGNWHDL